VAPLIQATIEHRIFVEFPNMISRLNEVDDQADVSIRRDVAQISK
jgi:hypothetical protein